MVMGGGSYISCHEFESEFRITYFICCKIAMMFEKIKNKQ